jgi:GT2 family glycosyltransferase
LQVTVHSDTGQGVSRARNLAVRLANTEWLAFVDDDCLPEPTWFEHLSVALREFPDVDFISGRVRGDNASAAWEAALNEPERLQVLSGRWTKPERIGFSVCMVVRRSLVERLGGWDERLGPGSPLFPAAEDIEFNYRVLRSGAKCLTDPRIRAIHAQWRTPDAAVRLAYAYMLGQCGAASKHFRTGDIRAGLWLWALALEFMINETRVALGTLSTLRARIVIAQLLGFIVGSGRGLRYRW